MEVTKRAKTEELAQSKVRREIKSFDDEGLWAEFEPEGIDRILSGEIKPKTLITNYGLKSIGFPQRGALIAKEMLSVFPNSRYMKWAFGFPSSKSMKELIGRAKEIDCTSIVIATTNIGGDDEICIISLMNGTRAYFRVLSLIPREEIPDRANLPRRLYPEVRMNLFTSPASVGTARLIQSLFPKVTPSRPLRNPAYFHYKNGHIFYRKYWLHYEKPALEGGRPRVTRKECGPRFGLRLTGLTKVALDTGKEKLIFMGLKRLTSLDLSRSGEFTGNSLVQGDNANQLRLQVLVLDRCFGITEDQLEEFIMRLRGGEYAHLRKLTVIGQIGGQLHEGFEERVGVPQLINDRRDVEIQINYVVVEGVNQAFLDHIFDPPQIVYIDEGGSDDSEYDEEEPPDWEMPLDLVPGADVTRRKFIHW